MNPLPPTTATKLAIPASMGGRHGQIVDIVCSLVGNGWGEDSIFAELRPKYGQDVPDSEIISVIRWAQNKPFKPTKGSYKSATSTESTRPIRYKVNTQPPSGITLPTPINNGAMELVNLFSDGEYIQIASADEEGKPSCAGTLLERNTWVKHFTNRTPDQIWTGKRGLYVRINPMNPGATGGDSGVSSYRHALLESDTLSPEQTWQIISESGVPCAVVITSGNKSLHAWVRVDARDKTEYKEKVALLYEHFAPLGFDTQNSNPSRFSRLPDTTRGQGRQELVAVNIGASSFNEWIESRLLDCEELYRFNIADLATFDPTTDPNSVLGKRWLCRGGSMLFAGQSGIGKSSLLMQLALTWATGKDAFGIAPRDNRPLKSLIIQAENDLGDMAEMFQGVCSGLGLNPSDKAIADQISIYRDTIHTQQGFIDIARRLIERHKPDIVWGDPLMSYLADDVSRQDVVSKFLRNWLNPILLSTGAIWIWTHHTPKPSNDPKARSNWTTKDMAYVGFGSSELTNWARETASLMRADRERDVYQFALSKRGKRAGMLDAHGQPSNAIFLEHAPDSICWNQVDFLPEGANAPMTAKPVSSKVDKIIAYLASPRRYGEIMDEIKKVFGAKSKRTIETIWKDHIRKLCVKDELTKTYRVTPTEDIANDDF